MLRSFVAAVFVLALACPALQAQNLDSVKNPKVHKAFSSLEAAFGTSAGPGSVPALRAPRTRVQGVAKLSSQAEEVAPQKSKALAVPLLGLGAVNGQSIGGAFGGLVDKAKSKVSGLGDKWRNGNVETKLNIVAGGAVVLGGGFIVGALAAPEAAGTLVLGGVTSIAVGAGIHYGAPLFQRVQDGLAHFLPGS